MRIIALAVLAASLTACDKKDNEGDTANTGASEVVPQQEEPAKETRTLEIHGRMYSIPAEYIPSYRTEAGNAFVRLKVPGFSAEIVLDEGSLGKTDAKGAPQIFSINDRDYRGTDYFERGDGWPIICRSGMRAQSSCDTLFEYAGTRWMLLLPNSQRDNAKALVEKAQQLLKGFSAKGSTDDIEPSKPGADKTLLGV